MHKPGNGSPGSSDERWSGESAAVGVNGVYEELEGISLLEHARSDDSQQSGSEDLALFGLVAEADLSPLNGRSKYPLG